MAGCVPLAPRLITLSPCCLERVLGFGYLLINDVKPPLREPERGLDTGQLKLGSCEPVAQLPEPLPGAAARGCPIHPAVIKAVTSGNQLAAGQRARLGAGPAVVTALSAAGQARREPKAVLADPAMRRSPLLLAAAALESWWRCAAPGSRHRQAAACGAGC